MNKIKAKIKFKPNSFEVLEEGGSRIMCCFKKSDTFKRFSILER